MTFHYFSICCYAARRPASFHAISLHDANISRRARFMRDAAIADFAGVLLRAIAPRNKAKAVTDYIFIIAITHMRIHGYHH